MINFYQKKIFSIALLLFFTALSFAQNSTQGNWGNVINTDVIPVAAANLPNGNIIAWSAKDRNNFGGDNGRTYTTIFNPSNNSFTERLISNTDHDMFCPGIANLPEGGFMVTGGSSSPKTSIYNPNNDSWNTGKEMNTPRGYHSMVTLRDGRIFTLGGSWSGGRGNKNAEVWTNEAGWIPYPGITADASVRDGAPDPAGVYRDDNHAWLFAAPNGKVFHAGPSENMHWLELDGIGEVTSAGARGDDDYAMNGNAVMYDIGKILTLGGADAYDGNSGGVSKKSHIIDISGNGTNVSVTRVGDLNNSRRLHNSVVLPSGEVVAVGGVGGGGVFTDDNSRLTPEIWNPNTEQWTSGAPMSVPRNYHSVAILMQDGRVWTGGGGLCGTCDYNHPDAQIYTPPYLYKGNNKLATIPVLLTAPSTANYHSSHTVTTSKQISSFVLMRMSSVTHSTNNEQRRVPLEFTENSNKNYTIEIPERSLLPPGDYFLFGLSNAGIPSVAKVVRIGETAVVQEVMDGDYYIQSTSNGQNVVSASWDDNNVRMENSGTANDQKWTIKHLGGNVYTIRNVDNNEYMEVPYGACGNGENIGTFRLVNDDHHKWIITRVGTDFFFRPLHCKNSAIDKNVGNGNNTHLWTFSVGNNNQKFQLLPVNGQGTIVNGGYYIRSFVSGQNLIAPSSENYDAVMYEPSPVSWKRWTFTHVGNGLHTIRHQNHDRYLVANGCYNGADVNTWVTANNSNQQWYIDKVGNGYFLRPAHCTNRALDKNAAYLDGEPHLWNYDINNNNQKWELIPQSTIDPRSTDVTSIFDATPATGRKSALHWVYEQSKEVEEYVIQYATENDEQFMNLDSVYAYDGTDFESYEYLHEDPIVGINYYQIKIKFTDGTVNYLPFRNVSFEGDDAPIAIFPNPTEDQLFIDLSNYMDEKINYFISNAKGEVILHGEFDETHLAKEMLELARYQNGNYFIYLRPENHRETTQQFMLMNRY